MPMNLGAATATTTNDYADLLEAFVSPNITKISIQLVENNTNAIKYKVLGTIDDSTWEEIKAEATLAKNATIALTPSDSGLGRLGDPWSKVKVQHKASVGGSQGNTTCTMLGS